MGWKFLTSSPASCLPVFLFLLCSGSMEYDAWMRAPLALVSLLLVVGASACAPEYDLVLLPGVDERPQTPCSFEATAVFPAASDYEEIGRVTAEFWPSHDLVAFKASIAEPVCRVGADVVVAMYDGPRISEARLFRKR